MLVLDNLKLGEVNLAADIAAVFFRALGAQVLGLLLLLSQRLLCS
jgi:hypothetical protein